MVNKELQNMQLRNSGTPYKLFLDKDTGLPKIIDLLFTDDPEPPKFPYFSYEPILFKNKTLTIRSNYHSAGIHNQEVTIKNGYLLVSCSCGVDIVGLCSHVIELFARMNKDKKHGYFELYQAYPFTDQAFYNKYLPLEHNYRETTAIPKPEYGQIYNYENAIDAANFSSHRRFCLAPYQTETEDTAIPVFAVAYNYHAPIPFLISVTGVLNEERTEITSFKTIADPSIVPERLNPAQKLLFNYSQDFDRSLDFQTMNRLYRASQEEIEAKRQIAFDYWKKVIPLLKLEKHLFYHDFRQKISYTKKLPKHDMTTVSFADEPIIFKFVLTEFKDHYKLQCKACQLGQDLEIDTIFPRKHPFFFSLKQAPEVYYQFSSLEEGRSIAAFTNANRTFTILKHDFEAFNTNILAKLALHHPLSLHLLKKQEPECLVPTAKQIRLKDQGDYVAFSPMLVYNDELSIPVSTNGNEMLHFQNATFKILQRNKVEEEAFKTLFMDMHPAFKTQEALPYFYLSKQVLKTTEWFARNTYKFSTKGIDLEGLEQITDINFQTEPIVISVNVQEEKGWFDIDVSVSFGELVLSPEEIQKAVKKRSSTLQLSNGKTAHLPDAFFEQLSTVFNTGTLTNKGVKVAGQHYTLIDQLYNKTKQPELTGLLKERKSLFEDQQQMPLVPIPENLNATLRPYQRIGFSWLCHLHDSKWGGLLADDMGLGKTLQVLTLLQHLKNEGQVSAPHLLLAPTSLLFNWLEEAAKFCPELNVMVYHGMEREKDVEELKKYDLIVTSYGTAAVDFALLNTISYHYLILDEAQAIKIPSRKSLKWRCCLKHRTDLH